LSVPVSKPFLAIAAIPAAHHGLGDLVRHLVVKPASALGEDHRSVGANFRPQLAQRAWRGVSPTSDMAQAIVQRSERYQIRASNAFQEVVGDLYDMTDFSAPKTAKASILLIEGRLRRW
jgi:hypothetical protein